MLLLSALLILFFCGLTIYFRDQSFIQIKPTIIYAFFALMLFAGLMRGKALLKYLLQAAYDGLTEEGWRKLSRNWAFFFVFMALANEIMRRTMSFDRSEEHTSELQSLMRISYAVFCLKKTTHPST